MQRQARSGTKPELELRRQLHRRGWRYRVNYPPLPDDRRRKADIVFTRRKVAVFVDGCFWHRCPQHSTIPKSNTRWWEAKLQRNVDRDRDTDRRLRKIGWTVVRIWEHEPLDEAVERVESALAGAHA